MFYHNINPVLLKIGFFEIRYYGLIFALNFVIAYFLLKKLAKIREINLNKDDIADFLLYEIIGVVLGARIVYVAVYNFLFYAANPLEIFAVWHGGLSFHGGLLGGILAGWIFCRKKNIHFLDLADIKKKEKGIDVWVAIDMIRESVIDKNCDACILISGDADFTPALEIIKSHGIEVLTAMVPWGYSTELRQKFEYFILNQEILKKCLRDYKDDKKE